MDGMGEATAAVEASGDASSTNPAENSHRVCCISCGHALCELAVETPEGSRVWLKTKCKGCKAFNVIVVRDGRLNVSTVQ